MTVTVGGEKAAVSSVNRKTGVVTLASAPANANGAANVVITFCKTVKGNADKINKCRFAGLLRRQKRYARVPVRQPGGAELRLAERAV